ncbi:hypothetical protein NC653_000874 [Populus alba x Populus x berolinensis]|uniref:Uncharacterized protein n=1 Tax=Populus alba x Populus x berolinensis TaxID=444605 RepID=A0AAD6RK48_9ROSI|nr:hypothetical protein NC653_000874 [Populus alba x Populus x berolinensis]
MVFSATVVGALLGLGTQMYSNALRKLPYMRHPWEHVVGMGLGVVFVNQLVKWDAQLEQDLDKMLQKAKEANERRYFVNGELPGLSPLSCKIPIIKMMISASGLMSFGRDSPFLLLLC